jgi:hypothetical protein
MGADHLAEIGPSASGGKRGQYPLDDLMVYCGTPESIKCDLIGLHPPILESSDHTGPVLTRRLAKTRM